MTWDPNWEFSYPNYSDNYEEKDIIRRNGRVVGTSPIGLSPVGLSSLAKLQWSIGESTVDIRQLAKFQGLVGDSTVDFRQL